MGKHFLRIKKRTRLNALISSVSIGIGTAVAALSVILLLTKLELMAGSVLYYILCAVGAAVISLVLYLLLMPSDRRLARRLDREHSFDEKIRTMVQFKDSDDDFVKLQREDADIRLADIRIKRGQDGNIC